MERKDFLHQIHLKLMGPKPTKTILGKRKEGDENSEKTICRGEKFCVHKHSGLDCALCKKELKGKECTKKDGTKGIHNGRVKSKYHCEGCGCGLHTDCWRRWHEEYTIPPTLEIV